MRPYRVLLALTLVASAAHAQPAEPDRPGSETTREVPLGPAEEEARAHFQLAQLQFRQGRFLEAAREFERAHELAPRPELLYNVYISYRDAGEVEGAARAVRQLLEMPEIPSTIGRERLEARLEALERQIEERRALEQRLAQQEAALRAREETAAPTAAPAGPWAPGLVVLGVGAAVVVAGVVTGAVALSMYSSVTSRCNGTVCPADTEPDRATGQALTITTDVLLPLGVITAAAGLVLALVVRDGPEVPVAAACGADGCMAVARGTF